MATAAVKPQPKFEVYSELESLLKTYEKKLTARTEERIRFCVNQANQRSTIFNHEALVGGKGV